MAQVAPHDIEHIQRWVDNQLARLPGYWDELPEIVATAESAPDAEAIAYIEEWRHFENQRRQLDHYVMLGLLTPEQQTHYRVFQRVVERHRPLLKQLPRL